MYVVLKSDSFYNKVPLYFSESIKETENNTYIIFTLILKNAALSEYI